MCRWQSIWGELRSSRTMSSTRTNAQFLRFAQDDSGWWDDSIG